jgi:hypothetical protein
MNWFFSETVYRGGLLGFAAGRPARVLPSSSRLQKNSQACCRLPFAPPVLVLRVIPDVADLHEVQTGLRRRARAYWQAFIKKP